MGKYKKCPRCELNWISIEEELCEVCKAELGKESKISLLEEDEDEAAAEYVEPDPAFGHAFPALLGQGEGERHPGDEEEQRENGVMVRPSVPGDMAHLPGQPELVAAGKEAADVVDEGG